MTQALENADISSGQDQCQQVYVIDDEVEVRRSLHYLLASHGFTCWPFASPSDFLENLTNLKPAPILVDLRMEPINGIDFMRILSDQGNKWPVVMMTGHGDIRSAVQATKLGAIDFLEKPFEYESLETSLNTAVEKLATIIRAAEIRDLANHRFDTLTPRESEVLSALMGGLSNKVAAFELSLSVRTIEMHRANALAKLGVKSMAEVLHLAGDAGMLLTPHKCLQAC